MLDGATINVYIFREMVGAMRLSCPPGLSPPGVISRDTSMHFNLRTLEEESNAPVIGS